MRFYEVEVDGDTAGCEMTLKAARALAESRGGDWTITAVEVPVNAETVRLLLGRLGGYATDCRVIEPK